MSMRPSKYRGQAFSALEKLPTQVPILTNLSLQAYPSQGLIFHLPRIISLLLYVLKEARQTLIIPGFELFLQQLENQHAW